MLIEAFCLTEKTENLLQTNSTKPKARKMKVENKRLSRAVRK